jgi:hypothetical protein
MSGKEAANFYGLSRSAFKKRDKRAEFRVPLFQESDMTVFFSKWR